MTGSTTTRSSSLTRRSALTLLLGGVVAGCASAPKQEAEMQTVWPAPPDEPRFYFEQMITGSADLQQSSFRDRLQRVAVGDVARGKGMDKPFGIVASNGRVFVGDTVGRRVAVYDLAAKRFYEFGTSGVGALAKPLGLAADRRDRIYVVDGASRRVNVYDAEGKYLTAIGVNMMDRPSGVAVNPEGTRIYVVDTGGVESENHRVRVFDGANGQHLFDFGSRGTEPGQFNLPNMATVGPDGSVYVCDGGNFRIQKFSPDGKHLMSLGAVGRQRGQFSRPKGVAVDHEGKLFVVDAAFGNFQIFNAEGQLLMHIGERNETIGPGRYLLPAGIAADTDGRIYVVDQFFKKIDAFRPANVPAERPKTTTAKKS